MDEDHLTYQEMSEINGTFKTAYNPEIVKKLQEAVSTGSNDSYQEYKSLVDNRPPAMLRDLLKLKHSKKKLLKNLRN